MTRDVDLIRCAGEGTYATVYKVGGRFLCLRLGMLIQMSLLGTIEDDE